MHKKKQKITDKQLAARILLAILVIFVLWFLVALIFEFSGIIQGPQIAP